MTQNFIGFKIKATGCGWNWVLWCRNQPSSWPSNHPTITIIILNASSTCTHIHPKGCQRQEQKVIRNFPRLFPTVYGQSALIGMCVTCWAHMANIYCRRGTNSASSVFCRIRTVVTFPLCHNFWTQYTLDQVICIVQVCGGGLIIHIGVGQGHQVFITEEEVTSSVPFWQEVLISQKMKALLWTLVGTWWVLVSLLQKRKWRAQFKDDGTALISQKIKIMIKIKWWVSVLHEGGLQVFITEE